MDSATDRKQPRFNSTSIRLFKRRGTPQRDETKIEKERPCGTHLLANALVVMSSTAEDRKIEVRISVGLQEDPPTGVSGAPTDNNIMIWNAEYPNKPPTVRFVSKMFHPNVYADGGICLDILQNRWSPTYDVSAILTSIQSLLSDPNPNSPANSMAAQLYKENRREYEKRVKACVEQSFSLLDEPNPNSPANSLAAQLYQDNKREYEKRVATVVELSWLNFQETRIEDPPENNTTH
uniref:UBC core domain-containing protein n=1 Tax=Timema cristinae TaxID=61476 RepID=A0A7R9CPE4_TIMCR|nr:unnamed protein product [Timema cristinae]